MQSSQQNRDSRGRRLIETPAACDEPTSQSRHGHDARRIAKPTDHRQAEDQGCAARRNRHDARSAEAACRRLRNLTKGPDHEADQTVGGDAPKIEEHPQAATCRGGRALGNELRRAHRHIGSAHGDAMGTAEHGRAEQQHKVAAHR